MPLAPLNRRTFLRSAGVCIGLPLLDAMLPVGLGAERKAAAMRPKRMLLISRPLGLHTPLFFPEKAGKDYKLSRYLEPLRDHRRDLTVFSGLSHLGYPGGHHTEVALLTGVPPEAVRFGDVRNTISLDQEAARHLGGTLDFLACHWAAAACRGIIRASRYPPKNGPYRSSSNYSSTVQPRKWRAKSSVSRLGRASSTVYARRRGRSLAISVRRTGCDWT